MEAALAAREGEGRARQRQRRLVRTPAGSPAFRRPLTHELAPLEQRVLDEVARAHGHGISHDGHALSQANGVATLSASTVFAVGWLCQSTADRARAAARPRFLDADPARDARGHSLAAASPGTRRCRGFEKAHSSSTPLARGAPAERHHPATPRASGLAGTHERALGLQPWQPRDTDQAHWAGRAHPFQVHRWAQAGACLRWPRCPSTKCASLAIRESASPASSGCSSRARFLPTTRCDWLANGLPWERASAGPRPSARRCAAEPFASTWQAALATDPLRTPRNRPACLPLPLCRQPLA